MTIGIVALSASSLVRAQGAVPASGAVWPTCAGTYADDFGALASRVRDYDRQPDSAFSYCTRNRVEYECLSYGADGFIRRERRHATMHGTAFAYRRQNGETLLLTNDHVAAWPAVTDVQHTVEGVPAGCKRISESLSLVDDERDSYGRDDVTLSRVVTDPQLDVAILRAHADLHVMPWKIGRSDALRERNVVEVRGFPLGAFRATSVGNVISAHDRDDEGDWSHDDFVIDALLSSGNSGSPVLAISCATGEYELVGIFHAGYVNGSALNVVVGVDQFRDLMTTLKRTPVTTDAAAGALDQLARTHLNSAFGPTNQLFFPFAGQTAEVRGRADGALLFILYSKEFPFDTNPILVIEDMPAPDTSAFGTAGRVWIGSKNGLKGRDNASLAGDAAAGIGKLLIALRSDAVAHAGYRKANDGGSRSRQSSDKARRVAKMLARTAASRADLVQALDDCVDRLGPTAGERGVGIADAIAVPSAGDPLTTMPGAPAPIIATNPGKTSIP